MSGDLTDHLQHNIPLSEMIQTLRQELQSAMAASDDAGVRFEVESVDLELHVQVARTSEAGGKMNFWVVEAGGKTAQSRTDLHLFKLKLKPVRVDPTGNGGADRKAHPEGVSRPLRIHSETEREPR